MELISNVVKNFIKDYSELINNSNMHKELVRVANETLYNNDLVVLFFMLREIGVNLDDYRWEMFDNTFLNAIAPMRRDPFKDGKDASWSRLDYILDDIDYQGFTHPEIVNHLKEVKDKLGIEMNPLPAEYGWKGTGDYDLGWFSKYEYKRLYPEEFED